MTEKTTAQRRLKNSYVKKLRLHEIPLYIWLVALWMMLWQEISLRSFLSGVLVAVLVTRLFFLPPVELAGRFAPLAALKYLLFFLGELVLGSIQVAWIAINPVKKPSSAVVAAKLTTRSDFILTITALTISLIPGSVVVDVDRFNSVIYLHMLDMPNEKSKHKLLADIAKIERLLVAAVGSKAEMERILAVR